MGTLYYGDNLDILTRYLADESVDLVYLDPPFNSAQNYNAFFEEKDGTAAAAQIQAFKDTWDWNSESRAAYETLCLRADKLGNVMRAFMEILGPNDMMAYLAMMAPRLVELHRVLRRTGSLYLHCDPTASHYLKLLLDAVFGEKRYRNEIVWKRASAHNDPDRCGDIHDTIFFYAKGDTYTWNPQHTRYTQDYIDAEWNELPSGRYWKAENMLDPRNSMKEYDFMGARARWRTGREKMQALWDAPQTDVPNSHGRIKLKKDGTPSKRCRIMFLDELPGVPLQSIWADIPSLRGGAAERLGYPTQKPVALLERIILASSRPGDVVLDPFCGCGTTVDAAQKLGRQWIGIDITHLAITLIKSRLRDTYGADVPMKVLGEPTDLSGARALAAENKYQFQWWALGLVGARPVEEKKGADGGVDGKILFRDHPDPKQKPHAIVFSVKGGGVGVKDVRELDSVVRRTGAAIGVLISLAETTKPMRVEAVETGSYTSAFNGQKYPRLQLLTIGQLLAGTPVQRPSGNVAVDETFKRAPKAKAKAGEQGEMAL